MQELQGAHDQEGQQLLGPLVNWVQKVQQLWSQQTDQAEDMKRLEVGRNELGKGLNQLQTGPEVLQSQENDVIYWHDQAQCGVAQWTMGRTDMQACTHIQQQHSDTKKNAEHLQDQLSNLPEALAQLHMAHGKVQPAKQPSIHLDIQQAPCISDQVLIQSAMSAGMAPTQGEPEADLNHGQQSAAPQEVTERQEEVPSQPQAEVPTTAAGTQSNLALDAEVEDKLQATRRVVASLQSTKVLAEHALAITRQQLAEANQKLLVSNLKLEEGDEKLAEYEQKLAVLDKTVQQLREDHKEGTQKLAESCGLRLRMQKKINKEVAKVEDLRQKKQGLTAHAKKLTDEVESLQRQIISMGANHVKQRQEECRRWEAILAERESELAACKREAELAAYKHEVELAACKRETEALKQDKALLQLQVQQQDAMHKGRFFGFNDWVCQQSDQDVAQAAAPGVYPAHVDPVLPPNASTVDERRLPHITPSNNIMPASSVDDHRPKHIAPVSQGPPAQARNAKPAEEPNMFGMIEGDYGAPAPQPQNKRAPYSLIRKEAAPAAQQAPNAYDAVQEDYGGPAPRKEHKPRKQNMPHLHDAEIAAGQLPTVRGRIVYPTGHKHRK